MTATDELRALLDERGVEYEVDGQGWVFFEGNGLGWVFVGSDTHGQLLHQKLLITPEQAVEATMGCGECHIEEDEDTGFLVCSECGAVQPEDYAVYFCWSCGRKVVE